MPDSILDRSQLPACGVGTLFPDRFTVAMLRWLRYHFGSADRIVDPALKDRVYTADDTNINGLHIGTLAEYTPAEDSFRPCLLIEANDQDIAQQGQTLGQKRFGGTEDRVVTPMTGSHVVFCLGGREGEAAVLASEVMQDAAAFIQVISERVGATRLRMTKRGRRQQLLEYKDVWTVPVFFEYQWVIESLVTPQGVSDLRNIILQPV